MGNYLNHESDDGRDLVIGLDAGGTRTRAVLAAADDGRVLGESSGGPGNAMTVPVPQLTDHLTEVLAQVVPERARARVVAVTGGFAGATAASEEDPGTVRARTALTEALRRLGIPSVPVGVSSDIEAAFAAGPGTPADGLALVAGTGAVAMRIIGRHATTTVDGDGWLLGDEGSGFWIGRSAVRAALRMADGRGRATVLAGWVGRTLGLPVDVLPTCGIPSYDHGGTATPTGTAPHLTGVPGWSRARREDFRRHLLPAVMADPPIRLARFAPLVAEAAAEKDVVAREILGEAAGHLLDTVRALDPSPGERIVATGGLLGPEGPLTAPLIEGLHAHGLSLDWVADGCPGAVALARLARRS
ncbi:ATPase [Streptomyces sp. NBC_00285]|uniref:N-acetylglucosamine kinase n=1 Tax=Streptomyces sp. NBC_00285 TaxID=2975700 RepID=UPI002E2D390F|nr:BadF/BadG/BcrA/BcrD ATPase family protein [Streptomyces sp. NBC_00285]